MHRLNDRIISNQPSPYLERNNVSEILLNQNSLDSSIDRNGARSALLNRSTDAINQIREIRSLSKTDTENKFRNMYKNVTI